VAEAGPLLGATLELEVGGAASGGSCVARYDGRVVFVRHALPGERVLAVVTEDRGGSFCRADAVQVLVASTDRVEPPCPYAGPGRCGGCDWQHAAASAQHKLKADVIRDQFARIGGIDVAGLLGDVEELPGGLLGWRSRITYAVDDDGRPGLHRHRDAGIEPVRRCPLGVPGVGDADVLARSWPGVTGVEVVRGDDEAITVLSHRPGAGRRGHGRRPPDRVAVVEGPAEVRRVIGAREFTVAASGFWQVHPHAVAAFADAIVSGVALRPGERVLELFAGSGALTAFLGGAVGSTGEVLGIEATAAAVSDAERNLADLPWAAVRRGRVDAALVAGLGVQPDVVVLDPPRAGAGKPLMEAVLTLAPRSVGYVSCDAASLARDVRVAVDAGWRLARLRAFDAFPMTAHVECVAVLVPAGHA
jgi:tRNA/tmRNA/rRNA uracil-C5-methylase (TrmA/RlmC/RlmD family)